MSGCQDSEMHTNKNMKAMSSLNSHQQTQWRKLSGMTVFFGHQSVGQNILDGIRDIANENPQFNVTIANDLEGDKPSGLLLIRSRVGENNEPIKKVNDFKEAIDRGMGNKADIALMKFCYVDFNKSTDVVKIFNYYRETMSYLNAKHPETKFVHVTVPVEINLGTWKTWIKEVIGKKDIWEYENAIPRGRYNALLRKEYEGKEPIFDLAMIESTYANGKKEVFEYKGTKYPALVREYTTDGGHLNDKGRKLVAEQLLAFLATL